MRVPQYDYPQVMPSGQGNPYFSVDSGAWGASIARIGGALGNLGDTIQTAQANADANTAKLASQKADADANDAFIKYRTGAAGAQADFLNQQGVNAVNGFDAHVKTLDTLVQETGANLSPEAKVKYQKAVQDSWLSDLDLSAMHAAKENQSYSLSAATGRVAVLTAEAATNFNDEKGFQAALAAADQVAIQKGQVLGSAPDAMAADAIEMRSNMWSARLNAMADQDPARAIDLYATARDQIGTTQRLAIEDKLRTSNRTLGTTQEAQAHMDGSPVAGVRPGFVNQIAGVETAGGRNRGQVYPNTEAGRLGYRSSPAGAVGVMQIMPATGRQIARSLGLPFSIQRLAEDDQYNILLGTTYLHQQLQRYGGHEEVAAAAYNAGPGRADVWYAKTLHFYGPNFTPQQFAAMVTIPETRNYVQQLTGGKYVGRPIVYGNVTGPITGATPQAEFEARVASAKDSANAAFNDAMYTQDLETKMRSAYATMKTAYTNEQNDTYASVSAEALGGAKSTEDLSRKGFDAYNSLPPDKQDQINTLFRKNSEGYDKAETPDVMAEYHRLRGEAVSDPAKFAKENLPEANLSRRMQKELIDLQVAPGTAPKVLDGVDMASPMALMKSFLGELAIAPKDKEYNQFFSSFSYALSKAQADKGKALNDQEIVDIGTKLLQNSRGNDHWFSPDTKFYQEDHDTILKALGIGQSTFELSIEPPPVPDSARQEIIDSFLKAHGTAPNEEQIQMIYTLDQRKKQ